MAKVENINPSILAWARETAGLSLEEAAERMSFSASEQGTGADKIKKFEIGERFPTRNQLMKFSQIYRRPLVVFYMKEPPKISARGEDFRNLSLPASRRDAANLDALLRDIRARQEMVKSLLEDEDEAIALPFVESLTVEDGVHAVAKSISDTLSYDYSAFRGRRNSGADDLFRELRARAESVGIFVILAGDLGSHHSAITESIFRGFVIADKIAPFVVINDHDSKSSRSFTLLHELAHIWIGKGGISGAPDKIDPRSSAGYIEQFCNDVAGEFLLPNSAFQQRPKELDSDTTAAASPFIARMADAWCVSEPMVAYRLNRLGWISKRVYRELASDYAARWNAFKARAKEKAREENGGPSYYVIKQFKLGNALIDVVRRTLRDNLLSHTKAAKMLGVKPGSVEPLLRNLERSRGALL